MAQSLPPQPRVLVRDGTIVSAFRIGDKVRHRGTIGTVVDRHAGGSLLVRHDRTGESHWTPARDLTLLDQ